MASVESDYADDMPLENTLVDRLFNMTFWVIAKQPWDFYDIYTLANLKNYRLSEIKNAWVTAKKYFNAEKAIYSFDPGNFQELERVITVLLDREQLPISFRDVYSKVCCFTCPIFEYLLYNRKENKYWDVKEWRWLGMDT